MKNSLKRFTALALCLLMLLPILAACNKKKQTEETSGPVVTPDGIVLASTPVVIAGGDLVYTVARPQNSTDAYSTCLTQLINIADGFTMAYRIAKDTDGLAESAEILLGNTCRAESKDAMAAIGYDDFSITYVNNKIVIAAHTPQRLKEAVTFLKEKLLQVKDGKLVYIGDYRFTSTQQLLLGAGESLADYRIVCSDMDNLYGAASTIKQAIKKTCGVDLKIVLSNQPATEREIVIGTPREGMTASANELALDEGVIAVQGKSILITSRNVLTTVQLATLFAEEYLSGTYTNQFNFKSDFFVVVNAFDGLFQDATERADGTEVRVMSFNLLVDLWGNAAVKGRDTVVVQTLLHYAPDVIGLQEASSTWHNNLKLYLKNTGYQLTCTERTVSHQTYGKHNFNPIMYNTETLTLLDSGVKEYAHKTNQYMRTMSWALFEVKATGEKFVHLNTHFDAPGKDEQEKAENLAARKEQCKELIAFKDELVATYNCPLFATGDFNTVEGSDKTDKHLPYWYLRDNGLNDSKYSAEKIKRQPATWHDLGVSVSASPAGSFDHVFGTDRVAFKYFNTLIDRPLMSASDHCPVYADAVLN